MAAITLSGITKRSGAEGAVDGIELSIPDGAFVVILGPSGCGKSTRLRMIAGLEEPSAGRIEIGDVPVTHLPPGARGCAMVFQTYALYPTCGRRCGTRFSTPSAFCRCRSRCRWRRR
ncbi:MAG: ATP-binding cassette domain-containing protein [Gemmobacter sp.]